MQPHLEAAAAAARSHRSNRHSTRSRRSCTPSSGRTRHVPQDDEAIMQSRLVAAEVRGSAAETANGLASVSTSGASRPLSIHSNVQHGQYQVSCYMR